MALQCSPRLPSTGNIPPSTPLGSRLSHQRAMSCHPQDLSQGQAVARPCLHADQSTRLSVRSSHASLVKGGPMAGGAAAAAKSGWRGACRSFLAKSLSALWYIPEWARVLLEALQQDFNSPCCHEHRPPSLSGCIGPVHISAGARSGWTGWMID